MPQTQVRNASEQAIKKILNKVQTKNSHFRADCWQCGKNALALLNEYRQDTFTHCKPGVTRNARWMGGVLYCQKKFMWADKMK